MLQKENRLSKVRDFNLLFKSGQWFKAANFSLRILELEKSKKDFPPKVDPKEFVQQLRIAFTVGVKLSKSAVVRKRLKRQMREIVRLLLKDNKIKTGSYLLFVAQAGSVGLEYVEIEKQVLFLLKKANCLS